MVSEMVLDPSRYVYSRNLGVRMGGNSSRGWYRPDHSKTASDGPDAATPRPTSDFMGDGTYASRVDW